MPVNYNFPRPSLEKPKPVQLEKRHISKKVIDERLQSYNISAKKQKLVSKSIDNKKNKTSMSFVNQQKIAPPRQTYESNSLRASQLYS